MQEETSTDERPDRYARIALYLVIVGVFAVVGCGLLYLVFFHSESVGETSAWGAFGDFVSGIAGTILAGATLVALALTLSLQARELDASRRLLKLQATTLHKQAFEATFFQLLHRFTAISEAQQKSLVYLGAQVLVALKQLAPTEKDRLVKLQTAYTDSYRHHESAVGPYYRIFYHVINFVDAAELTAKEKADYISLARAQLGANELRMLFMNVVALDEGRTGLKPLVEKYGLLKHARNVAFDECIQGLKHSAIHLKAYLSMREREPGALTG
jgi:hypothetical protein